jgi:hypothetical protein
MTRLVHAELVKLTRRRATIAWALLLTSGAVLVAFAVLAAQADGGPVGGLDRYRHLAVMLMQLGSVAAIMVGCAAGAGDRDAGILRDLVATGRARTSLFAVRIPAVLAIVMPLMIVSAALLGGLAIALAGSSPAPSTGLVLRGGAWLTLAGVFAALLGLGAATLGSNQGTAVGVLIAWQLVASPLLQSVDLLGDARWAIPLVALDRLEPAQGSSGHLMPVALAAGVLAAWGAIALGAGFRRLRTQDV